MTSRRSMTSRILAQTVQKELAVKAAAISNGDVTVAAAVALALTTALSFSVVLAAELPSEADGEAAATAPSAEDYSLVETAHELRRKLAPPHQSLFCVVCVLVYEDYRGGLHLITGTNAESSIIGGSICAERAAMCKLREARDCKRVTKVVVVTDNPGPLAPGILCREFLSTHLPPTTPVIMAGSGNEELSSSSAKGRFFYPGSESSEGCSAASGGSSADIDVCTVRELYPWRNVYGLTQRGEQLRLGLLMQEVSEDLSTAGMARSLGLDSAVTGAYDGAWRATARDNLDEEYLACCVWVCRELLSGTQLRHCFLTDTWRSLTRQADAVAFEFGYFVNDFTSSAAESAYLMFAAKYVKALEYGATLDPVTLLAPAMLARRKKRIWTACVLLVDQFGNLHAPFAQARTFLTEQGFGDTKVVFHVEDGKLVTVDARELVPKVTRSG